MANEKNLPDSNGSPEKTVFKNAPRSNRIIWILIIAGMGAFLFIAYNLLDAPGPGRRSVGTSNNGDLELLPAVGQYSDAYNDFLRTFKTNPQAGQSVQELPSFTRSLQSHLQSQAGRQSAENRKQVNSFLASLPENVKVVQKEPSKEYTASRALLASALTAKTEVKLDSSSGMGIDFQGPENAEGSSSWQPLLAAAPDTSSAVTDAISSFAQPANDLNSSAMAHQDRNASFIQKNRFQTGGSADGEYVASSRRTPRSRYELMAGTLISGVLMGGVNSDTPGTVLGQISENVYDTATGSHLLIPQGARMVGVYDSHVIYGQNRLVVVWQRILYPDGTSLNLEGMIGGDQAGNAGFKQYVDHHYSRLIGAALFASVFTAAGKIATDNDKDNQGNESKMAEAVMETMAHLGAKLAERNMNVAPTLRIRPGYRFSIVTTKDIAFAEPYIE
jgi:type IV secretion system protein VirB10